MSAQLPRRFHLTRRQALQAAGAAAALGVTGVAQRAIAADKELNILVWCDHTDAALLQPFEQAHNCRLNVKDYQDTGAALAILEQSRPGDWDVFVVDSGMSAASSTASCWRLWTMFNCPGTTYSPTARTGTAQDWWQAYAIPEKFGYNSIAFDRSKVQEADVRRADIMWSPKYKGRIAVYDYYIPAIEMVALGMGIRPDQITEKLPTIRSKLLEIKKLASVVGDVPTVQNALVTGAADIIVAGGEFVVAGLASENPDLDWVLPDSGGIRWMQAIGIFDASKKKDLAAEFVKYITGPDGRARLATASCYWAMPTNSKAALGEKEKQRLRWNEQPGFIRNSYPYFIPDAALDKAMLEVWTEFLQA